MGRDERERRKDQAAQPRLAAFALAAIARAAIGHTSIGVSSITILAKSDGGVVRRSKSELICHRGP
jgi:hypothetical protein